MFDVLISGRLVRAQSRTASNGKPFALAQVSVPTEGDESLLASCIAFRPEAVAALLALDKGDAVALAGKAKLSSWTAGDGTLKHGLNVTADQVLTVYNIRRKREAVATATGDDRTPDVPSPARGRDRATAARPASAQHSEAQRRSRRPTADAGDGIDGLAGDEPDWLSA